MYITLLSRSGGGGGGGGASQKCVVLLLLQICKKILMVSDQIIHKAFRIHTTL